MKAEELTKKQVDVYHELLGYMASCITFNTDITVEDIRNRFKQLNDKGLLPESLKYLIL